MLQPDAKSKTIAHKVSNNFLDVSRSRSVPLPAPFYPLPITPYSHIPHHLHQTDFSSSMQFTHSPFPTHLRKSQTDRDRSLIETTPLTNLLSSWSAPEIDMGAASKIPTPFVWQPPVPVSIHPTSIPAPHSTSHLYSRNKPTQEMGHARSNTFPTVSHPATDSFTRHQTSFNPGFDPTLHPQKSWAQLDSRPEVDSFSFNTRASQWNSNIENDLSNAFESKLGLGFTQGTDSMGWDFPERQRSDSKSVSQSDWSHWYQQLSQLPKLGHTERVLSNTLEAPTFTHKSFEFPNTETTVHESSLRLHNLRALDASSSASLESDSRFSIRHSAMELQGSTNTAFRAVSSRRDSASSSVSSIVPDKNRAEFSDHESIPDPNEARESFHHSRPQFLRQDSFPEYNPDSEASVQSLPPPLIPVVVSHIGPNAKITHPKHKPVIRSHSLSPQRERHAIKDKSTAFDFGPNLHQGRTCKTPPIDSNCDIDSQDPRKPQRWSPSGVSTESSIVSMSGTATESRRSSIVSFVSLASRRSSVVSLASQSSRFSVVSIEDNTLDEAGSSLTHWSASLVAPNENSNLNHPSQASPISSVSSRISAEDEAISVSTSLCTQTPNLLLSERFKDNSSAKPSTNGDVSLLDGHSAQNRHIPLFSPTFSDKIWEWKDDSASDWRSQ